MITRYLATSLLLLASSAVSHAWDINDLLNRAGQSSGNLTEGISDALNGIVNGIFTTSDLEVKDLAGTWVVQGSAVSFQSEEFLKRAGGNAAASMIEARIDPYFQNYGLTGAILTIKEDGSFSLKMKRMTLSGTVSRQETQKGQARSGNFLFNFNKSGITSIGSVNTYVAKTPQGLDVMFDASRLQSILSSVATFTNNNTAKTLSELLNRYDGICIGFRLVKSDATTTPATPADKVTEPTASGSPLDRLGTLLENAGKNKKKE